ncbi:class I SAM-dependent methyltransferase [Streptomyces sp. NPDC127112]|uniref:class I SAM-dependent methyltransferase n=1 Tax=Streptomyces sp. NPDC127112 TaxID=3345364 RepID=UPI00363F08DE
MTTENTPTKVNRAAWDLRTAVHLQSDFYPVDRVRAGQSTLHPPELALAGDVRGLRLLHLQCHFGLDTLSWARLGAEATGIDFSPAAVSAARTLAEETGLPARFECADVLALDAPGTPYDLAVTTYGVLCWLDDLDRWARAVHRVLRPGGRLVLVEFHPLLEALHPGRLSGAGGYFPGAPPQAVWTEGTYTDPSAPIRYPEYRWQHPVGSVVAALVGAGMEVIGLREYPHCSYRLFDELDTCADGLWSDASAPGRLPYMYAITATRKTT